MKKGDTWTGLAKDIKRGNEYLFLSVIPNSSEVEKDDRSTHPYIKLRNY